MITIHESKKGTQYVWASELKMLLEVTERIETWMQRMVDLGFELNKEYSIHDRIYQTDSKGETKVRDWAIKIDMAKHIALLQNSRRSKALRAYLIKIEKRRSEGELLDRKQIIALIDLCKVLGLFSVQKYLEKEHYEILDKPSNWWEYRAKLLGYSAKDLKAAVSALGEKYQSQRQAIMVLDRHKLASRFELIKIATIDLFIILGKSEEYAKNMGLTALELAKEFNPEVYNDLDTSIDFRTPEQKNIIDQVQNRPNNLLERF